MKRHQYCSRVVKHSDLPNECQRLEGMGFDVFTVTAAVGPVPVSFGDSHPDFLFLIVGRKPVDP